MHYDILNRKITALKKGNILWSCLMQ
jgi:hypothetical protein